MSKAELLTPPQNYAVVQLPERQYPGVVIQGDSLFNLARLLEEAADRVDRDERDACLTEAREILEGALSKYERVLDERSITLPYSRT